MSASTTQKRRFSARLRPRIARMSQSVFNAFNVRDSENKDHLDSQFSPQSLLAARAIILLLLASLAFLAIHETLLLISSPPARKSSSRTHSNDDSFPSSEHKSLHVRDYPTILVSESKPFKARSTPAEKTNAESSLVTAKIDNEITKSPNFNPEAEPIARMIVITMNREKPLRRLLKSLKEARYGDDHVDLDIWIDRRKGGEIHQGVLQASRDIDWNHGTKVIHKRAINAGLYQQWIYTWNITEETTEFAVILEDDLELSPTFYQWLRLARAAYSQDANVGAFTLQRSSLRPRQIKGVASGPLNIPKEHQIFKYKLLGTWGFAPQRDQWVEFRTWFEHKRQRGEKPYVKGLVTTSWYKSQEVNGFAPTMWSQWWIKFVEEKGYFTVTANLPNRTTLSANWREAGLHYSKKKPATDFPIYQGNEEQFFMPENPILVDWDGRTIPVANDSKSM